MTRPTILITCKQMQVELPRFRERFEDLGFDLRVPELKGQQFSAEELIPLLPGVVGAIAGDDELTRAVFESAPDLGVLIRWGVGMDSVDLAAAAEHGVLVKNTPGVFGHEVADSALAFMLMLARGHHEIDLAVRSGGWPKREGITLAGNRLGVIGLGAIGAQVAIRGLAFGMEVVGYDPYAVAAAVPGGVSLVSLEELLSNSRFVVVTCPSTPETFHLIGPRALELMRADAFLVNVARGPIVDEAALADALARGGIAGAGLDVFETEPLPAASPLRSMPNVILGAHNGSNTREGVGRASAVAVDLLIEGLGA